MGAWLGLVLLVAAVVAMGLALTRQFRSVTALQEQVDRLVRTLPQPQPVARPEQPRLFRALYDTAEQPIPEALRDPTLRLVVAAGVLAAVGLFLYRPATAPGPDPAQAAEVAAMRVAQDSLRKMVDGLRDSLRTTQLAAGVPVSRSVRTRAALPPRARNTRTTRVRDSSPTALPSLPTVPAPASP